MARIKNIFRQSPSGRIRSSDLVKKIESGRSQDFAESFFEAGAVFRTRFCILSVCVMASFSHTLYGFSPGYIHMDRNTPGHYWGNINEPGGDEVIDMQYPTLAYYQTSVSLVYFPLESIPANARCISAKMSFYASINFGDPEPPAVDFSPLTLRNKGWNNTTTTWNNKLPGVPWRGSQGAATERIDFSDPIAGVFIANSLFPYPLKFELPLDIETVQTWIGNDNLNAGLRADFRPGTGETDQDIILVDQSDEYGMDPQFEMVYIVETPQYIRTLNI